MILNYALKISCPEVSGRSSFHTVLWSIRHSEIVYVGSPTPTISESPNQQRWLAVRIEEMTMQFVGAVIQNPHPSTGQNCLDGTERRTRCRKGNGDGRICRFLGSRCHGHHRLNPSGTHCLDVLGSIVVLDIHR